MKYDLIIEKIPQSPSKQIIAKYLASVPSMSHQEALSLLSNLPNVYLKGLSEESMRSKKDNLEKLGIRCVAIQSGVPQPSKQEKKLAKSTKDNVIQPLPTTHPVPQQKYQDKDHIHATNYKTILFSSNDGKTIADKMNKQVQPKLQNKKKQIIIMATVCALIIVSIYRVNKASKKPKPLPRFRITPSLSSSDTQPQFTTFSTWLATLDTSNNSKNRIKGHDTLKNKRSLDYIDSAKNTTNDNNKAIAFYKIAISFNKYNITAWQGLLHAYRESSLYSEVEKTQKIMNELFGSQVFTIEKIIQPYGTLSNYYTNDSGICRIEYQSNREKREDLMRETFLVLRAVSSTHKCKGITLYASTGRGKGMLVRIAPEKSMFNSLREFKKQASVSFIE